MLRAAGIAAVVTGAVAGVVGGALSAIQTPPSEAYFAVVVLGAPSSPAPASEATRLLALTIDSLTPIAGSRLYGWAHGQITRIGTVTASTVPAMLAHGPPVYDGVTLSVAEAAEILRGNEAIRDGVIARECRARPAGTACGGAVRAAATALLEDVDRETASQIEALVDPDFGEPPPCAVVVVTTGMAYRTRPQKAIDRLAASLRRRAAPLVIVRTVAEPVSLLGNVVTDLRSLGVGRAIDLRADADLDAATQIVRGACAPPTLAPAEVAPPRVLPSAGPPAGNSKADPDLVNLVAGSVRDFERIFSAIIWHETYTQEDRRRVYANASGARFDALFEKRRLESELLFVWLPREATWLAVRDVIAVDGRTLPKEERRLPALLATSQVSIAQLRVLAEENGRYNIGNVLRTFNEPTLAITFLDDRYRSRFRFARAKDATIDGTRTAVLELVEEGRPTIIRHGDRDLPVSGSLAVDPRNGRILRTTLEIADKPQELQGTVTVTYRYDRRLDTMVPDTMRESYRGSNGEHIECRAVYTNFRRFETSGRIIIPQ